MQKMCESLFDEDGHPQRKVNVVLADDHPLMRQALRNILCNEPDFKVIAEATNGEEATRLSLELVPDVVIMDISMPKLNGLEATLQIKEKCPEIAVLILTVHSDNEHIISILKAGASGYLTKSASEEEIVRAVRAVVAGETVISARVWKEVVSHAIRYAARPSRTDKGIKFTTREIEVLKLVAMGMSNKYISEMLGINLCTTKGHLVDIFNKLKVGSRTGAVTAGLQAGLLTVDDIKRSILE